MQTQRQTKLLYCKILYRGGTTIPSPPPPALVENRTFPLSHKSPQTDRNWCVPILQNSHQPNVAVPLYFCNLSRSRFLRTSSLNISQWLGGPQFLLPKARPLFGFHDNFLQSKIWKHFWWWRNWVTSVYLGDHRLDVHRQDERDWDDSRKCLSTSSLCVENTTYYVWHAGCPRM